MKRKVGVNGQKILGNALKWINPEELENLSKMVRIIVVLGQNFIVLLGGFSETYTAIDNHYIMNIHEQEHPQLACKAYNLGYMINIITAHATRDT